MKATYQSLILIATVLTAMLCGCDSPEQRYERAQALYKEGVGLRQQRLSEEAAEKFLQALETLDKGENDEKTLLLESQLKDNLGAMYNKHGLFEDALTMHREAIANFKLTGDSIDLMGAYRNCGRVTKMLEQYNQSKRYTTPPSASPPYWMTKPCRATSIWR